MRTTFKRAFTIFTLSLGVMVLGSHSGAGHAGNSLQAHAAQAQHADQASTWLAQASDHHETLSAR